MSVGLYIIKSSATGKVYVGQSLNREKRMRKHSSLLTTNKHPNSHLQSAWNKYGAASFEFRLFLRCPTPALDRYEALWIQKFSACGRSYNQTLGAGRHQRHTEATKRKIGDALRGRTCSDAVCARMSAGQAGRVHSYATKLRMRENHKGHTGKQQSAAAREAISKSLRGHQVSATTREKLSQAGRKLDALQVTEARALRIAGAVYADIAAKYGVSAVTVSRYLCVYTH